MRKSVQGFPTFGHESESKLEKKTKHKKTLLSLAFSCWLCIVWASQAINLCRYLHMYSIPGSQHFIIMGSPVPLSYKVHTTHSFLIFEIYPLRRHSSSEVQTKKKRKKTKTCIFSCQGRWETDVLLSNHLKTQTCLDKVKLCLHYWKVDVFFQ